MKLVERSDGLNMNLNAALFFTPHPKGMVVEFPGNVFFIVYGLFKWHLLDEEQVHWCEFEGWPIK